MNPDILVSDEKKITGLDVEMDRIASYRSESVMIRGYLESNWAESMKIYKGIPLEGSDFSKVRNRKKIYFRKVWSSIIRLVA